MSESLESLPQEVLDTSLQSIATTMTSEGCPNLNATDAAFFMKLVQVHKKYDFTEKQEYWFRFLFGCSMGLCERNKPAIVTEPVYKPIHAFFEKAKTHLKYPKVEFKLPSGGVLALKPSGPNAAVKYKNTVLVTDGKKYPSNLLYGFINEAGEYNVSYKAKATEEINNMLGAFANNPAEIVKKYGHETGVCCFCGAELSDPGSKAAGFGPVCAKNYGLLAQYKMAQTTAKATA